MTSPQALQDAHRAFRSRVAQQKIDCGGGVWTYYDDGPKTVPPIILIPGVTGTAECFFRQFLTLCPRGYRLISVQWPALWSVGEWVKSFDQFLAALKIEQAHILGSALGGYLALCYAQIRQPRIASLILSNAFIDTHYYFENAPCVNMIKYTPLFVLQRQVLKNLPTEPQEPDIATSIDFMVEELEKLTQTELASRLVINCSDFYVRSNALKIDNKLVTIIDVMDKVAVPEKLRDEVYKYFPEAKVAQLKTGGNFPYLSQADDFNLHLQVHMRAHGVQPHATVDPNAPAPIPDLLKQPAAVAPPVEAKSP